MKRIYHVGIRCVEPHLTRREYIDKPASSLHYVVREALASVERQLPQGWRHIEITVTR